MFIYVKMWSYNELPTVNESGDSYIEVLKDAKNTVYDWLTGVDGWLTVINKDGVLVEQLELPNSQFHVVRAHKQLKNVNVDKLLLSVTSSVYEEKKELYEDLLEFETVKLFDNKTNICYSKYKTPFGISNREFVSLRNFEQTDDLTYVLTCQAVNYEPVKISKDTVRGTNSNGRLIKINKDDRTTVDVITVDHIDPKGAIPSFIVNSFKMKTVERLKKMEQLYHI